MCQHHRIAIEPDEDSVRTNALSDLTTMSAGTDGSVQHRQSGRQLKLLEDFTEHDWYVARRSQRKLGGRKWLGKVWAKSPKNWGEGETPVEPEHSQRGAAGGHRREVQTEPESRQGAEF